MTQEVSYTTYTYDVDLAVALCEGPISGVLQIFANEKLIYDIRPEANWTKKEWLDLKIYLGTETQEADPTLEAIHGAGEVPAYRGLAYVVFTGFQLEEFGNRIPSFRFVVVGSGTSASSEISTDVSDTGDARGPVYHPSTNLLYATIESDTYDEPAMVAMDPLTKSIVWRLDGRDQDGNGVRLLRYPQRAGGDAAYATIPDENANDSEGLIIAIGKDETTLQDRKVFIASAYGGTPLQVVAMENTAGMPLEYYSLYSNKIRLFGATEGFDFEHVYVDISYGSWDVDWHIITKPDNYDWYGNVICAVKQGNVEDFAVVAAAVEHDTSGDLAVAIWADFSPVPLADHQPTYQVETTFSSNDAITAIAYDDVRDVFWVSARTTASPYVEITRLPHYHSELYGPGEVATLTFNWFTDYSISSNTPTWTISPNSTHPVFAGDWTGGYLWLETSDGKLWRWDISTLDASNDLPAPTEYTGTTIESDMYFLDLTQSLWGAYDDDIVEYRFDRLTPQTVTLSSIVDDLCDRVGLASADYDTTDLDSTTVNGYVVHNMMPARSAVDPLRKAYLFDHADTGSQITFVPMGQSVSKSLTLDDIGAYSYGQQQPPVIEISRAQELDIPKELSVTYMDIDGNYEIGHQRARAISSQSKQSVALELPVVWDYAEAAQKAEILLHLARVEREAYTLNVMPVHYDLIPSDVISVNDGVDDYEMRIVEKISEQGVIRLRAIRNETAVLTSTAAGAATIDRDASITARAIMQFELLALPPLRDKDMAAGFYGAGYSYSTSWPGGVIAKSADNLGFLEVATFTSSNVVGRVWNAPTNIVAEEWDDLNSLTVSVYAGSMSSLTRAEILAGRVNAAAWGTAGRWEIVQFTTATLGADGNYTVSGLLRGRLGTNRHANSHVAGDLWVMLDADKLRWVPAQSSEIGSTYYYKGITLGTSLDRPQNVTKTHTHVGAGLLCYAPAQFAHYTEADLDVVFTWVERTREIWRNLVSGVSSDPGDYEVDITDGTTTRTLTVSAETATYTRAQQETDFGSGTTDTVTARVYQVNSTSRGNYAELSVQLGQHIDPVRDYALGLSPTNYWSMNDTDSTMTNEGVSGIALTCYGGYANQQTPGIYTGSGYAVKYNGADYGRTPIGGGTGYTWYDADQTWVYMVKLGGTPASPTVFMHMWDNVSADAIRMDIRATRKIRWRTKKTGTWTDLETTTALSVGTWYVIAGSIGADGMKLYVNGTVEASDSGVTTWDSNGSAIVCFVVGDNPFLGLPDIADMTFDHIMTWHGQQLSDAQVQALTDRMI